MVSYSAYNAALIQHNILVKAKNFLVFQGDVEAVASQSPKELSRLIDQISGSLELAPDYEKARDGLERATENATFNFTKRRGMMGEIKQYKEQKGEAERFEQLCQERVRRECLSLLLRFSNSPFRRRTTWFSGGFCTGFSTSSNPSTSTRKLSGTKTRPLSGCARNSRSTRRPLRRRVVNRPRREGA